MALMFGYTKQKQLLQMASTYACPTVCLLLPYVLTAMALTVTVGQNLTEISIITGTGGENCNTICGALELNCAEGNYLETNFINEWFYITEYEQYCNEIEQNITKMIYDSDNAKCQVGKPTCDAENSAQNHKVICLCSGLQKQGKILQKFGQNVCYFLANARLSDDWIQLGNKQYHINDTVEMNWDDAVDYCKRKLISYPLFIRTAEEQRLLAEHIRQIFPPGTKVWMNWKTGKWQHINKAGFFENWAQNQPSVDCAYFDRNSGKWSAQQCDNTAFVICQLTAFRWWKTTWGYFSMHKNKRLNASMLENNAAKSIHNCVKKCRSNVQCLSANYNQFSNQCALFSQFGTNRPNQLIDDPDVDFVQRELHSEFYDKANPLIKNVCFKENHCKNGASCLDFNDGESYKCICAVGWMGTHCDQPKPCNKTDLFADPAYLVGGTLVFSPDSGTDLMAHETEATLNYDATHYMTRKNEIDQYQYTTNIEDKFICHLGTWVGEPCSKCTPKPATFPIYEGHYFVSGKRDYWYRNKRNKQEIAAKYSNGVKFHVLDGRLAKSVCPERERIYQMHKNPPSGGMHRLVVGMTARNNFIKAGWTNNRETGDCVLKKGQCGLFAELREFYRGGTETTYFYRRTAGPLSGWQYKRILCYIH